MKSNKDIQKDVTLQLELDLFAARKDCQQAIKKLSNIAEGLEKGIYPIVGFDDILQHVENIRTFWIQKGRAHWHARLLSQNLPHRD
jgi:hypothetical protein